jgi:disulfide oxidoreductase YuzD
MSEKRIIVINQEDEIVAQIPAPSVYSACQRLLKETRRKYPGMKCRVGYIGVSKELFDETKKLLEEINTKYPSMFKELVVKERPEFTHLGYELNNG